MLLGMNLEWANYFQPDMKFIDLMAVASFNGKDTYIPAKEGYLRPGNYVLTADGIGTLYMDDNDIPVASRACNFSGAGERYTFAFTTLRQRGLLRVTASNAANPVKNIRLFPAELDPSAGTCHPDWIASLKGMNTLRSVHFYDVEASAESSWSSAKPGLWKLFARACNEVDAHPWINLPHLATPDYCTQIGKLMQAELKPHLVPKLEYSNEIWNWSYPWGVQSGWVNNRAAEMKITLRQCYAKFAAERFDAFGAGFGRPVVRVLAGQYVGPWTIDQSLDYAAANGLKFDAIAGAPYAEPSIDWPAVKALWAAGLKDRAVPMITKAHDDWIASVLHPRGAEWTSRALKYGVQLYAYEWGPGVLVQKSDPDFALKSEIMQYVHRSQVMADFIGRMADAMSKYFTLGNFYSHCRPWNAGEYWGLREYLDDQSPKADAFAKLVKRWNA